MVTFLSFWKGNLRIDIYILGVSLYAVFYKLTQRSLVSIM